MFGVELGAFVVDAAVEPAEEVADFFVFAADGFEGGPVDVVADAGAGDAADVEALHEGFCLAWLGGEDVLRSGKVVQHFGRQAEGGDSNAVFVAEVTEGVGEGLVFNRAGVEEFSTVGPGGDTEILEEFLAEEFVVREDPQGDGTEPVGRESEAPFEGKSVVVEGESIVGRFTRFPVDDRHVRIFPEVADGAVLAENVAKGEGKAAIDLTIAGRGGAKFAHPHEGVIDRSLVAIEVLESALGHRQEILGTGKHGDRCGAAVVALTFLHFGDGGARVAGHDGEMIPQGGIGVISFEAHAHQADQFGSFNGFPWAGGKKLGENVAQLLAQAHGGCCSRVLEMVKRGHRHPRRGNECLASYKVNDLKKSAAKENKVGVIHKDSPVPHRLEDLIV